MDIKDIIELEMKGSFDFFWKETVTDKDSPAYGLIRDGNGPADANRASIASVGFGLSAIIIGVEKGWITKEEGEERALGTLKTFWYNAEELDGFFFHFLDMQTAKKYENDYDVASIIDTSLFLNGAITVAEYFGGEVAAYFEKIYKRVDWTKYYDVERNYYFMGYTEETGGTGQWDHYAEQLMQYILGVASPTYSVPAEIYDGFERQAREYKGLKFFAAPHNPLFIHQYSHAWYDFEHVVDADGVNWFDNSVQATKAQRQYTIDNQDKHTAYNENAWGFSASDGPNGYNALGAPAWDRDGNPWKNDDGTIAPTAAISSIVFTPEESLKALEYFYNEVPELWSEYGFLDSFNQDGEETWVAERVIGIDKGAGLLMLFNHQSHVLYDLYMNNAYIKKGTDLLNWKQIDN